MRTRNTAFVTGITVIGFMGILMAAAENPGRSRSPGDLPGTQECVTTHPADWPCLAVWHDGGMRRNANSGLKLAVWSDGTILLSPREEKPGESLLVGKVDESDVKAMLQAVRDAGFFELGRDYVVPDSSYATIAVRGDNKAAVHSWHGFLLPGFGGDLNTDPSYRAFIKVWKRTAGAIESLAPVELHRLSERAGTDTMFRGYVIASPQKTGWFIRRNW
jgi:hypothetical protein